MRHQLHREAGDAAAFQRAHELGAGVRLHVADDDRALLHASDDVDARRLNAQQNIGARQNRRSVAHFRLGVCSIGEVRARAGAALHQHARSERFQLGRDFRNECDAGLVCGGLFEDAHDDCHAVDLPLKH
jgi:hypothetical protein